jgi:hypothetical protein
LNAHLVPGFLLVRRLCGESKSVDELAPKLFEGNPAANRLLSGEMKMPFARTVVVLLLSGLATTFAVAQEKSAKVKPYPLKTCVVSDEALGGDHGEPYVFTHNGREVKLCCKPCLKDFNKDTAKYIKKMEDAEKKK